MDPVDLLCIAAHTDDAEIALGGTLRLLAAAGRSVWVCDLTQGELATWVAASRESVNKVLSQFRDQGLIAVDGQEITILDREGLEDRVVY